jgi:hypothetical protein
MRTVPFKQKLLIAVVGYGIVGLFCFVFLMLHKVHQRFAEFSITEEITLSTIAVSPLLLAALWGNIKGLKFADIEIALSEVRAEVDFQLASDIQTMQGSGTPELVAKVSDAVKRNNLKLVEVNLRVEKYWWSTRLYLLAALADEYTNIERLIFVAQNADRFYIGMASPSVVRKALAKRFPYLELAFEKIQKQQPGQDASAVIQQFGWQWPILPFLTLEKESGGTKDAVAGSDQANSGSEEYKAKKLVGAAELKEWIPNLETQSRDWDGARGNFLLYEKILNCSGPYVPLLHGKRLELVVSREELMYRLACSAVTSG